MAPIRGKLLFCYQSDCVLFSPHGVIAVHLLLRPLLVHILIYLVFLGYSVSPSMCSLLWSQSAQIVLGVLPHHSTFVVYLNTYRHLLVQPFRLVLLVFKIVIVLKSFSSRKFIVALQVIHVRHSGIFVDCSMLNFMSLCPFLGWSGSCRSSSSSACPLLQHGPSGGKITQFMISPLLLG